MREWLLKSISILKWVFLLLLLILLSVYFILRGSLPDVDGQKIIALVNQSVIIERDALGIPTIRAENRADNAFALGYIHAQERFFQMDLLRRKAAGELSALFGDATIENDIQAREHRFRERARALFRQLPKEHYVILQAYANGVNIGLDNLSGEPFEYMFIGQKPEAWELEDSLLCMYAMFLVLNDELGERKTTLAIMKQQLPEQWYDFLTPEGGIWDAPLDGLPLPESATALIIPQKNLPDAISRLQLTHRNDQYQKQSLPGSNNWAIDKSLTGNNAAMLANDMHLNLRVPNIWYRASWYLDDGRRITGVTLPGVPAMIAGSNENIAWGYTNSYGNWGDIIVLQTNADNTQYLTDDGWRDFSIHEHSVISSTGKSTQHLSIETIWGPVIGKNHNGKFIVHQWIAYAPHAVNLNLLKLESVNSVTDVLDIAPDVGIPPQNMVVVDKEGHIGWTIAGVIPERNAQSAAWSGYQSANNYPRLYDPQNHRIWSANNRLFSGETLAMVGFEGGDLGARAQQIRDDLFAKEQFTERDLLAIQLDSRAVFLQRWKQLLSDSLKLSDTQEADLTVMSKVLKQETNLSASSDSVAYGLVKTFRKIVVNHTIGWIYDVLENNNPQGFKRSTVDNMIEYPVWELITNKPEHLIPAGYSSWDEFLLAAARKSYNELTLHGAKLLQQQTWGRQHQIELRHPLSKAVPGLGFILDMPRSPLSGDDDMPKVLSSDFGAAVRMVVAPGQEGKGIMHMPAGQSSHPLSPYYSSGHEDWVNGKASAFLPGETQWLLELKALQ